MPAIYQPHLSQLPAQFRLTNLFLESRRMHLEGNGGYGSPIGLNGAAFMSEHQNVSGTIWKVIPHASGYVQLTTMYMEGNGLVLEGNAGMRPNHTLGGAAYLTPDRNSAGTMWKLIPLANGTFQLTTLFIEPQGWVLEGGGGQNDGPAFLSSHTNVSGTMWKAIPA